MLFRVRVFMVFNICKMTGAVVVAVIIGLPATGGADVTRQVNAENGLVGWKLQRDGLELELIQRLPDQTRAFFLARGFSAAVADDIGTGCVFQTIARNVSRPPQDLPVAIALAQWRVRHGGELRPVKLKEQWDREWPQDSVSAAARLAFRWATFPTEQTFEPGGDYNWGMTGFDLPPGETFDLQVVWQLGGRRQVAWINNIECPADR